VHIAPEGRPGNQYKQFDESSFVAVSGYREFCILSSVISREIPVGDERWC
jgi:hypothetical protein